MRISRRSRDKKTKDLTAGSYKIHSECDDTECVITVNGRTWIVRGVWEEVCLRVSEDEDLCLNKDDVYK